MWGCCFKKVKIVGFVCLNVGVLLKNGLICFRGSCFLDVKWSD